MPLNAPRIYQNSGSSVTCLEEDAANHVGRVLRMLPEQEICLFNGQGRPVSGHDTLKVARNKLPFGLIVLMITQ